MDAKQLGKQQGYDFGVFSLNLVRAGNQWSIGVGNRVGPLLLGILAATFCCIDPAAADSSFILHTRSRVETLKWKPPESHTRIPLPVSQRPFTLQYKTVEWHAHKTAIIICDMWDTMRCKISADRIAVMATRMNVVVTEARERGVLIVHAPSGTMDRRQQGHLLSAKTAENS